MNGILALVEHAEEKIKDITWEGISFGQELSQRFNLPLSLCLLAPNAHLQPEIENLADEILLVKNPLFAQENSEIYADHLLALIQEKSPKFVLIGHTAFGVEIAPHLAVKLGYGFIPDCSGYDFADGQLLFLREIYGGKILSSLTSPKEKVIITLRSGSFKPKALTPRNGKVIEIVREAKTYKTKVLGYKETVAGDVDISRADFVIGVGRGIKSQENLSLVEELAKEVGAVIGGSRPIIDLGWLPKDRLIGSSGKTIKPKVYIALGISGAFQHISGMKDAETIIAVNKDQEAPIFSIAHYGIVGDLTKVLPILKEKIKELKS